ncbi:MAG: tight adherence protein [Frankiaceae bacterium]|jgi:tight adherence protein B|nr:tight adherence protein [Frankiaceae bacterium]
MTGLIVGLVFGLGALLAVPARDRVPARVTRRPRRPDRRLYGAVAGCGLLAFLGVVAVSGSPAIAVAFAGFGAYAPVAVRSRRARLRTAVRRDLWPDVVDNLCSAVRAGLSLPEALTQLGERGPAPMRPDFVAFGRDYAATGRFGACLDRLKERLDDPVGDRIVEALRLAREVGGSDLGRLLRNLSQFLRDDARTRAELVTRQGWTVNAARLALAAPWVVLALLSLRPETVAAYDSPAGVAVLAVGGGVSVLAYRLMLRIGRLPEDERVLR